MIFVAEGLLPLGRFRREGPQICHPLERRSLPVRFGRTAKING